MFDLKITYKNTDKYDYYANLFLDDIHELVSSLTTIMDYQHTDSHCEPIDTLEIDKVEIVHQ